MSKDAPKAPVKAFPFQTSPKIPPEVTEQDRERARALWWKLWNTPCASANPDDISNEEAVLAEALAAERERALKHAALWLEARDYTDLAGRIRALLAAGQPAEGAGEAQRPTPPETEALQALQALLGCLLKRVPWPHEHAPEHDVCTVCGQIDGLHVAGKPCGIAAALISPLSLLVSSTPPETEER